MTSAVQTHGVEFEVPVVERVEETLTTELETEFIYGEMVLDPSTIYHVTATGFTCYSNQYYWWGSEDNILGPVYTYVDAKREIMNGPTATMLELADWSTGAKLMYEGHTIVTEKDDFYGRVPRLWNGSEWIMVTWNAFNMEHFYHGTFTGYSGTLAIWWPLITQVWLEGWDPFAPQGNGVTFHVRAGEGDIYVFDVAFENGTGIVRHGVQNG